MILIIIKIIIAISSLVSLSFFLIPYSHSLSIKSGDLEFVSGIALLFILLPFSILYFVIRDYLRLKAKAERLKFFKTFIKGVIPVPAILLVFVLSLYSIPCEEMGCLLIPVLFLSIMAGGIFFSFIFTSIASVANSYLVNPVINAHSLLLNIIKIILIIGIVGVLVINARYIFIKPTWYDTNDITVLFATFFLYPVAILYFALKDYLILIIENKKINFIKSFLKGVFISMIVAIIDILVTIIFVYGAERSTQRKEQFILTLFFIIGGLIFQLILTTIFYFKNSKNQLSNSLN